MPASSSERWRHRKLFKHRAPLPRALAEIHPCPGTQGTSLYTIPGCPRSFVANLAGLPFVAALANLPRNKSASPWIKNIAPNHATGCVACRIRNNFENIMSDAFLIKEP